jgi:hypothetical protein
MENKKDEAELIDVEAEYQELQALLKRADKENPKPEDLREIRKMLDNSSALVRANELSELAFKRVIETISKSALMGELIQRQIKEKREAFGYKTAHIIEKMLIDQVILCSIRLNQVEMVHSAKTDESHSHDSGMYWEKRLSGAQRRFQKACETLAKVQKHLAEANHRELQAQNSRRKGTILANNLLKDLTN